MKPWSDVTRYRSLALAFCILPLSFCHGSRPDNLGVVESRLAPCPSSPNCVSSDATDSAHAVEPFALVVASAQAWPAVRSAVANFSRTRIVDETADYLHAECQSLIFRFVDDLELQIRPTENAVAVRSASRLGHSDLGANRRRVEALRSELVRQGIVRPLD
jgi:uncharacterized protein (DUF1499 family)